MVESAAAGLFGAQPYQGRDCGRCNRGYYPFFGDCLQCPDPFGYTSKNALTVFGRYLIIWLLWMFINRILYAVRPTELQRSHALLLPTAAQHSVYLRTVTFTGLAGATTCSWQTRTPYSIGRQPRAESAFDCGGCSCPQAAQLRSDSGCVRRLRSELARRALLRALAASPRPTGGSGDGLPGGLSAFFTICGILDFDLDVTGPQCTTEWSWGSDAALQLSLPMMVSPSVRPAWADGRATTLRPARRCAGRRWPPSTWRS